MLKHRSALCCPASRFNVEGQLNVPLALFDVPDDPELTGAPTRVYVRLLRELDFVEFRPVKAWALAQLLKMRKETVGAALARLVKKGFLEREKVTRHGRRLSVELRGVRAYRLVDKRASGQFAPNRAYKAS